MAIKTISNAGGDWADNSTWGGAQPTANDDVVATATSGNVTIAANAVCKSINLTNYVGILTHGPGRNLTIGNATGGDMLFVAGMTYITSTGSKITFVSGVASTITTAGKTINAVVFNGNGSWTLQDNLNTIDVGVVGFTMTKGTFNANGFNVTANKYVLGSGVLVSVVNMGSGTWTVTNTAASAGWGLSGTGITINPGMSTLVISANTITAPTINALGSSLYNLTINGSLTTLGITIITNITIFNLLFNGANTIMVTQSVVITITNTFYVSGLDSSNILTISTGGLQFDFVKSSGIVAVDWLNLADSNATGGATFYAGSNSIDNGNNTGWIFGDEPEPQITCAQSGLSKEDILRSVLVYNGTDYALKITRV